MKNILIADDKADVRALVQITLDVGDFTFIQVENGTQALEAARTQHPDLMILDVMMPGGMDGYQVCEAIKKDEKTKDILVLLLTARGQEFDKKRGKDAGADDYFVKPFSPRELLDKVYKLLNL